MDEEFDFREMFENEFKRQIEELSETEFGSEEYARGAKAINDMYNTMLTQQKNIQEDRRADEKMNNEYLASVAAKEDNKNRQLLSWMGLVVNALSTMCGFGLNSMWLKRGFEYEKEGSYTSKTFWSWIQKQINKTT